MGWNMNPTHIESMESSYFAHDTTYYIKGNVDADEFLEAIAELRMIDVKSLSKVRVVHCLARYVPLLPHQRGSYEFDYFVYFDQEKGCGAFPMTYADV